MHGNDQLTVRPMALKPLVLDPQRAIDSADVTGTQWPLGEQPEQGKQHDENQQEPPDALETPALALKGYFIVDRIIARNELVGWRGTGSLLGLFHGNRMTLRHSF